MATNGPLVPEPADRLSHPDHVTDGDRARATEHFRSLVARGDLSLDRFSTALDQLNQLSNVAELETLIRRFPGVVTLSAPARRLQLPLQLDVTSGSLRLKSGWQLGAHTNVVVRSGSCRLDLRGATWDDWEVELSINVSSGSVSVTVPDGVQVQLVAVGGNVHTDLGPGVALPGAPLLRVSAHTRSGVIKLAHPKQKRARRSLPRWLARRHREH